MNYMDIVFDGPPGHEGGRFVEVEDDSGKSINVGTWLQRPDGYWVLRIVRQGIGKPSKQDEMGAVGSEATA